MTPKTEAEERRAELQRKIDAKDLELKRAYEEEGRLQREVSELEEQYEATWK